VRSLLSSPLERLVAFVEQRGDVRQFLAGVGAIANVLRRGGFPMPSVAINLPWPAALVMPETPHVLRVVLVALVARRPERTAAWPAGSSPRQVDARLKALWLAMLDALDPAQLDPWLPLGERARWFLHRVAQVYRRNVRVGVRLPPDALRLAPPEPPRIGIVPSRRPRASRGRTR
jgi:hypothetical protein